MRRIGTVVLVKDAVANQRNSENLEVSLRSDAEISSAKAFFLLEHGSKIIRDGLGDLILRRQKEHSVRKPALNQGQAARGANSAHARDLFETVNQVGKKDCLTCLCFGVVPPFPWKRDVHRNNFVYAEPGIHFEHFHQAAPEQSRSDHENQGDRHLRRYDCPANALAALGTRLSTPAFFEALPRSPEVPRTAGEPSEPAADRGVNRKAEQRT